MFCVIEGLDGVGKSTQLELLKTRVSGAEFLSFPDYDSESGRLITRYLSGEFGAGDCYFPTLLYAVDRAAYFRGTDISEDISKDISLVISARYTCSNAIYQAAKLPQNEREEYFRFLYDLEYGKLKLPKPDKVIFLYLPEDLQFSLLESRGGGDIHETREFQRKCRDCAGYLAARDGWAVINCSDGHGRMRCATDINDEIIREIYSV
ncbi:thymidylate kinase [Clostridia bacterium]|nr:thymidylate kinase [Clostridia bacterium]